MVVAGETVNSDLESVTISNWTSEQPVISHDEGVWEGHDNVLRADLGLLAENQTEPLRCDNLMLPH